MNKFKWIRNSITDNPPSPWDMGPYFLEIIQSLLMLLLIWTWIFHKSGFTITDFWILNQTNFNHCLPYGLFFQTFELKLELQQLWDKPGHPGQALQKKNPPNLNFHLHISPSVVWWWEKKGLLYCCHRLLYAAADLEKSYFYFPLPHVHVWDQNKRVSHPGVGTK